MLYYTPLKRVVALLFGFENMCAHDVGRASFRVALTHPSALIPYAHLSPLPWGQDGQSISLLSDMDKNGGVLPDLTENK